MCTVQFIGSMHTCAANGSSYTASIFFDADENTESASPSLRRGLPPLAAFSMNCLRNSSLDSLAAAPSFHWICNALRPCIAAQEFSATTATPPVVDAPRPESLIWNTSFTPGTTFALVASKDATSPLKTGQRARTAYNKP